MPLQDDKTAMMERQSSLHVRVQRTDLGSDNIPPKVIVELIPVCVLLEGLIQVQLPRSDVAECAKGCHIHIGLCKAEEVYANLHVYFTWRPV